MTTLTDPRPQLAAQRREAIAYLADLGVIRRQVFALWPADEAEAKAAEVDADLAACEAVIAELGDRICERPELTITAHPRPNRAMMQA